MTNIFMFDIFIAYTSAHHRTASAHLSGDAKFSYINQESLKFQYGSTT